MTFITAMYQDNNTPKQMMPVISLFLPITSWALFKWKQKHPEF